MPQRKIIIFDMDGVLTEEVSSWRVIHKYFGVDNAQNLNDYLNGKIDYEEFMRRDIALWPKKTHIGQIEKILSDFKLIPGTEETIKILKTKGYQKMGIISAGLDILADQVGRRLSLEYIFADGLEADKNGYLTGEGIHRVDLLSKDKIIIDLSKELKIPPSEFIAIGDSKYDISMLKAVGFSIAFNPKDEEIKKAADVVIEGNDIRQILEYL